MMNLLNKFLNLRSTKKKGTSQIWWIIASAIIAVLVVIFIIIWFKGSGEKAFDTVGDKIGGLKDCDCDNVADMFDKCACTEGQSGATYDGCPKSVDTAAALTQINKDCTSEFKCKEDCKGKIGKQD